MTAEGNMCIGSSGENDRLGWGWGSANGDDDIVDSPASKEDDEARPLLASERAGVAKAASCDDDAAEEEWCDPDGDAMHCGEFGTDWRPEGERIDAPWDGCRWIEGVMHQSDPAPAETASVATDTDAADGPGTDGAAALETDSALASPCAAVSICPASFLARCALCTARQMLPVTNTSRSCAYSAR